MTMVARRDVIAVGNGCFRMENPMTRPKVFGIVGLAFGLLLVGCQAPDAKPFDQFAQAVTALRGGADDTLNTEYTLARARYEHHVLNNNDLASLFLDPDSTDPYGWKTLAKPPLYVKINQFKIGVGQLNDAIAKYAALLQQLAGSNLIKQDDFDKMATDLSGTLADAVKALKPDATADATKGIAVFSALATEAARNYIEHKRTGDLINILRNNQSNIASFAALGSAASKLVAQDWQKEYIGKKNQWVDSYVAAKSDDAKIAVIETVLKENDNYTGTLETLRSLDAAYRAIPAAHQELCDSLQQKKSLVAEIAVLVAEAKHLQSLYNQLKQAPSQQ